MKPILLITFFVYYFPLLSAFEPTEKFDRDLFLYNAQPNNSYRLYWKVINDNITFEVHVSTLGWIGLGLSPNGAMPGSVIVITGVKNKQPYLYDCFATAEAMPVCEEHSNYVVLYGAENETHTVVKFTRKLNTCAEKDWKITNDTFRVIWAYNPEDAESSTSFKKHTEYGHKSIMFLEKEKGDIAKLPADVTTYDLNVTNFAIPTNVSTLYLCKIFKMPKKQKHHIVKYEALITPGNERIVHHIVVFHCLYDMEKFVDKQEPCFSEDHTRSSEMYKCTSRYLAGWGIGAGPVVYPENLGYPIFEEGRSPYLMIEFHYDTSKLIPGLFDNSGIRFYLTPTLRQQEIGSIITGTGFDNNSILLPPGQKQITLSHSCDSKCTQWLPTSGINILGAFLHQHRQGKALRLRHIRDGVELPLIAEDNYYDFNFQEHRHLNKPRLVLPNDTLRIECEWQTTDRKNMTFGGYASSDEMCFIFIDYYPKTDNLLSCLGGPSQETFAEGLGAKILSNAQGRQPAILQGLDGKNVTLPVFANSINWNADIATSNPTKLRTARMEMLQQKLNSGSYFEYCARRLDPNVTTDPALGDFMSAVAGQTVFSKNGVQLIEKVEENFFPPESIPEFKVLSKVPDLCETNSTSVTKSIDNSSSNVTNGTVTLFGNETIAEYNATTTIIQITTGLPKAVQVSTPTGRSSQLESCPLTFSLIFCSFYVVFKIYF